MTTILRSLGLLALLFAAAPARGKVPDVVASIAPVHSLVASIMQGVGEPELLVPASVSDHDYALKPSDLRKIEEADLVVWIGEPLETYLVRALESEAAGNLALIDSPGVDPRPYAEERGQWNKHQPTDGQEAPGAKEDGDHGHEHIWLDPHVWLDPIRAAAMIESVADKLADLDPEHAGRYRQNAAKTVAELKALDASIRQRLAPVAAKPFITFHDGYSYFVERYGLNQVGQLSGDPERRSGAASVGALRDIVAAKGVVCGFAEPQFDAATLQNLAGDATMQIGTLDAIGANLTPGPDLYPSLLQQNARAIESCLSTTN